MGNRNSSQQNPSNMGIPVRSAAHIYNTPPGDFYYKENSISTNPNFIFIPSQSVSGKDNMAYIITPPADERNSKVYILNSKSTK